MMTTDTIQQEIEPIREKLLKHPVYTNMNSLEDLRVFMEHHVFAVWDFMSLLKVLQRELTCINVPWYPVGNPAVRQLINEIVLGEETDQDEHGNPASHYELYIDAMEGCGANAAPMKELINKVKAGVDIRQALLEINISETTRKFVEFSFDVIDTNEPHKIASAFTFGREDLIPDMFTAIIDDLNKKFPTDMEKVIYYFDRHIEVDGDTHGPLAMQMIRELCGNDEQKWKDVIEVGKVALERRITLWDGVQEEIEAKKAVTA